MELEIKRSSLSRSTAPPRCLETSTSPTGESWLSRLSLSQVLSHAVQTNFAPNYSSCTVLLVCSLGSIVAHYSGHEEWSSGNEQDVGLGFFNLANDMFRDLDRCDWESVQCLLLMGQILAEFDFPASGLGKLASSMPLPVVPGAGAEPCHAQYQLFFLALISMRKLLNRILFHLYSRDHTEDPTNGEPTHADKPAAFLSVPPSVMLELDRQLEEWRTCLPQGLEFLPYSEAQLAETPRSTDERLRGHLMARYFAAKSIIHRPYIYKTLHHGATASLTDADAAGARTAIGSALMSVVASGILHEPLVLLLHPINSCRSLFACELQLSFVLRSSCHYLLPQNWKIAEEARKAASGLVEDMSPTAFRDGEILKLLAC
ncbi:hypothetical protein LB503_011110 [Fusarium chuoi]|nr:hypothetical protein LB503_011110 [Fusarium chuoi]